MRSRYMESFTQLESGVRSYCREFSTVFERARGALLVDVDGREYIDFLCGAGAVNYGHNNPRLKAALLTYLQSDGPVTSLDLHTVAKHEFIDAFDRYVLKPRELRYRLQFTGPGGTNAVESAIKLARKFSGRETVVAFTNAFHGMSATSLSLSGNRHHRQRFMANGVVRLPFDGYLGPQIDTIDYLSRLLEDESSGLDLPAAVILETIQVEGGINIASREWLRRLAALTRAHGIALIVDDIQVGCGRTGSFFSFEDAGIEPDLVCLSKSIGGLGMPMSLLLIAERYDVWKPGEDNGTFRGNNLAFVCGAAALREFWSDGTLQAHMREIEAHIVRWRADLLQRHPTVVHATRGRGLIHGLEFPGAKAAAAVQGACFQDGLIIERCGNGRVLKLLPPLTIAPELLARGLEILDRAIAQQDRGDEEASGDRLMVGAL